MTNKIYKKYYIKIQPFICFFIFFTFCFSFKTLQAFQPRKLTSPFITGFQEIPFFDEINGADRSLFVWYPVEKNVLSEASDSPWDLFDVAKNASIAKPEEAKPVIVLSHGWKGNPHQLSWLIRGLVYDGFIVIAIQHRDFINGRLHINHWMRAGDLSIAIDQFIASPLAANADLGRIGVAGFSLGGTTALLSVGGRFSDQKSLIPAPEYVFQQDFSNITSALPDLDKEMMVKNWKDSRIQAAYVIAPTWSWLFDEKSLSTISLPIYLVASEGDQVIVTDYNAGVFARLLPRVVYQNIPGNAGHYVFLSAVNAAAQKKIDPAGKLSFLFEDLENVDRTCLQFLLAEEAAVFFRESMP